MFTIQELKFAVERARVPFLWRYRYWNPVFYIVYACGWMWYPLSVAFHVFNWGRGQVPRPIDYHDAYLDDYYCACEYLSNIVANLRRPESSFRQAFVLRPS